MLRKLILALVVAIVVTLACILLGAILELLKVEVALVVGGWLKTYGVVLGVLAGLWYFFAGDFKQPPR